MSTITLATIIYEGNYKDVLHYDSWFTQFQSPLITEKLLVENNIRNHRDITLKDYYSRLNDTGYSKLVRVNEETNRVNEKYGLNTTPETFGYNYLMPNMVMIDVIQTDYILYVAGDCMNDILIDDDFLLKSMAELRVNPICSTTMVGWTKDNYKMKNGMRVAEYEANETARLLGEPVIKSSLFDTRANFTDQMFFGSIDKLQKINYNIEDEKTSLIYNGPSYGGNSFEKRMVQHQVHNQKYNLVYKGPQYYIHDNNYY